MTTTSNIRHKVLVARDHARGTEQQFAIFSLSNGAYCSPALPQRGCGVDSVLNRPTLMTGGETGAQNFFIVVAVTS